MKCFKCGKEEIEIVLSRFVLQFRLMPSGRGQDQPLYFHWDCVKAIVADWVMMAEQTVDSDALDVLQRRAGLK